MKLDKEGIIKRENGALKELQRVVRHCARIGAARAGAQSLIDDVEQTVMMLVIEKLIHVYDPSRDAEPFLIDTCRRMAQGLRREHSREVLFSQAGEEDESSDWQNSIPDTEGLNPFENVLEQEKEARAAALVNRVAAKLQEAQAPAAPAPAVPSPPAAAPDHEAEIAERAEAAKDRTRTRRQRAVAWAKPKREVASKTPRQVSAAGARIREIRTTLRYTHGEMAEALGVEQYTIRNLEYGFSSEHRPELVEKAEAMLEKHQRDLGILTKNPPELVHSWCTRLGLSPDDYSGLALVIGTNRSTTFRWLRDEGAPTPSRIRTVEAIVQIEETRRQRMAEAAKGA